MSPVAKEMTNGLLGELRRDSTIPPQNIVAAIIMGVRKFGLDMGDYREMMEVMRQEFGISQKMWSEFAVALLGQLPGVERGHIRDLNSPL